MAFTDHIYIAKMIDKNGMIINAKEFPSRPQALRWAKLQPGAKMQLYSGIGTLLNTYKRRKQ